MLGALALIAFFHPTLWGKGTELTVKVETTPVNRDAKLGASLAPVVKKAAPSVVNIYSTHIVHMRSMRNPMFNDPVFRQFFGDRIPDDSRERTHRRNALSALVLSSHPTVIF